ncbi:MAG: PAS domain S-box protein, partial [Leptospiraceae bacterium]|nr:PAS domain S-box protein [Leptospiraceae bacterium]
VVDGYNKIESMLQELEEQKGQLEIQNVIIQKTSEFINRVMDTMEEILIVIGTDGKVRQVNKKITILLGFKNEEILGENPDKFFSEANLVELREKYIPAAKEVPSIIYYIISNNAQLDLIANLVNKKQESIVHLIRGSLLYNQHGKKDGMVLVCTNIEELQRVQTQLIKTLEKVDNLRKESEHLLLNILPKDVAQELKTKGNVKPVSYEYVTVLFTDFKGFTNVAEKLNPEELIMELDTCFTSFDKIIENYSIEKLKTIGDAYMCAGGIPLRNRSNPFDVVLAALQVREFMEALKEERIKQNQTYFELRIGIHTGALVAGVVGKNKFAYDIWGDTVNMASRMESSGTPGKVNISIVTYGIIKDFFDCEARGMVYAKRKGDVEMFFVNRIKPEYSLDEKGIFPNQKFLDYIAKLR